MFIKKLSLAIPFIALAGILLGGLSGVNIVQKIANATLVNACSSSEIQEGNNCIFTKVANPQYETKCATGYTLMDATCSKFNTQACTAFTQGLDAENGLCKLDLSSPVYANEILDQDGRQCNGTGTNFKRYNVGFPTNSISGPVICGNNFSLLDKTTFRFLPRVITEVGNLTSIQTQNTYPACPVGYTELATNKCSRLSVAQSCNSAGEIFVNNTCAPCPVGQYCPADGLVTKTITVCVNGGILNNNLCIAPIKYSTTTYTDGCSSEYVKKDQSCAIVENRTHDLGCSYFYTSENVNVTATQGSDGYCSTGGRTDFSSASIFRVSDFNCNGVGTYYYNYNVAYDPLVCGNDYNVVGKTGFKWLPITFKNITSLQKIPASVSVCPIGWTNFDNSSNCSQSPIVQEYRNAMDCPINTYCPGSNSNPIPCPAGTISPARSTKLSDCVFKVCTNGAINPPSCNQCPSGLQLVNNVCLPICPSGVSRDIKNNCTICINGAANPSSGCNACPLGYQFNGSSCTVIPVVCNNGFELVSGVCKCVAPKVSITKHISNQYIVYCEVPVIVTSSSSISSSSISSSSAVAILPVTISGYVYADSNNNGFFENNENPISGVKITLVGTQDPCKYTNISTITNSAGYYQFSNLVPCTYSVLETQPTNYNNGVTTTGTIGGVKVGTITNTDRIDNISMSAGQNSINNNFGELLINAPASNNGGTIIINNNNNTPVTNNNNSVSNNNVTNNYTSSIIPVPQPISKPQFIPTATPVTNITYYQSPVANVTETIRSGGFNVILIISTLVAVASFGLIYIRGKRNQSFGNFTFSNRIER
jgi:SdrD B-like domain